MTSEPSTPTQSCSRTSEEVEERDLGSSDEKQPLTAGPLDAPGQGKASCRVCLEEGSLESLCRPCTCSGTMQHAHPECIQLWIHEKGDMRCEICKQQYHGDFSPPQPRPNDEDDAQPGDALRGILISSEVASESLARRAFYEEAVEFEEERASATWWLAAVLIFMALLLTRHALEAFTGPSYDGGGGGGRPSDIMAAGGRPDIADGGVTFAWGDSNITDTSAGGLRPQGSAPGGAAGDASPWVVLSWLTLRLGIILIPTLLAYRLMTSFRAARDADDAETERSQADVLTDLEAGAQRASSAEDAPVGGVELAALPSAGDAQEAQRPQLGEPPAPRSER